MKKILLQSLVLMSIMLASSDLTHAYDSYNPYTTTTNTLCQYGSANVGVGTLPHGVVVTIDSADYATIQCIKNTSWVSYFSSYGNTVSVSASNTTLGVQIVATSMHPETSANLKNTQWSRLLTGRVPTYMTPTQTQPTRNTYRPSRVIRRYHDVTPPQVYPSYPQYQDTRYYTPPARTYVAGSSIWNTSGMYRTLAYQSNGVKITLSSPDYATMRQLQSYHYAGLFRDFAGISLSLSHIAGGIEVTITAGSTSTVEQIQKIGYALVYN